MAQPVDLVVDRGVLIDIGIGLFDVGFGLVVIVIGDEVLDGIVGEQLLELLVELGGKRLIMRDDEGGLLDRLDGPAHRVGLARSRHPQEGLFVHARFEPGG
jgi:hypothetical protein